MPNFRLQAIYELPIESESFTTAKQASKEAMLRLNPETGDKRLKQINLIREMPKSRKIISTFYKEGNEIRRVPKL